MSVRIVFMGTPDFGVPVLRSLVYSEHDIVGVYTRADRPAGRGRHLVPSPVKLAAAEANLRVFTPESMQGEATISSLRGLKPDLIVVAAFAYLLPSDVLSIPCYGCLNVHPSLLPRYRGPSPVATALLNGDGMTGVSIMLMDSGLDTGPILMQERVPIGAEETTGSLTVVLAERGAALLMRTIDQWVSGQIKPQQQCETEASYSTLIHAADGLIDWSLPAEVLERRVRAFQPWPGCYTVWKRQRLKVIRAAPLMCVTKAPPGTVVGLERPFSIGVVTGCGVLALISVQLEGKRESPTDEFLRGQREFLGCRLGE